MKNKAGFKVGDKVGYLMPEFGGLELLKGRRGTVKCVYGTGAEVRFKTNKGSKIYRLANEDMIKVNDTSIATLPATPREKANDRNNTWEISITPVPYNRECTVASLIVNGRITDAVTVSRWHDEDEYDVGTAAYEAIKKMFDIKDKTVKKMDDTTTKEPEGFTGKIVCTHSDSDEFTKGKIYQVNRGILVSNVFSKYGNFKSVKDINRLFHSQFIEVVE